MTSSAKLGPINAYFDGSVTITNFTKKMVENIKLRQTIVKIVSYGFVNKKRMFGEI